MSDKKAGQRNARNALDLGAVWAGGAALLRDNLQLIAILAGLFVLLPTAAVQFTLPPGAAMQAPMSVLLDPGSAEAMREKAALALAEMISPFLMWAGIAMVVSHIGYAAIIALIGPARPTVGEALAQSLRVILPLILAVIITLMALYAALFAVQLVLSPLGQSVAAFLGSILSVLISLYLAARLLLTLPIMVIERELNPVKALPRSWRLTAQSPGNVFGFWMLMAVAWFVSMLVQLMISAVLSGISEDAATVALIQGLCGGIFAMIWGAIYCAMGVAMHSALAASDTSANAPNPEG